MSAFVLAAVFFTVSGTTPTIVSQKNVSSVVRNATGQYTINFTSTLSTANYGVAACAKLGDTSNDRTALVAPDRNSSTHNAYSTSALDILIGTGVGGSTSATDPDKVSVLVFDAGAAQSDILASAMWTLSGTTVTLQANQNVSAVVRKATGIYEVDFSSALTNADYSTFGANRYADFTNDASPLTGQNRNPTGSLNLHTTGAYTQAGGLLLGAGGFFDVGIGSAFMRLADNSGSNILAAVRFSVSGGVCTVVKSTNVSSVTYQIAGCYRVNFTSTLASANYAVLCNGKWADVAGNNDCPIVGPNRNSSSSRNTYSTSALDLVAMNNSGSLFDVETIDVLIFDASTFGASSETSTGVMTFAGISFAATTDDDTTHGVMSFSGISFSSSASAGHTATGAMAFQGISFAASATDEHIASGLMHFGGIAIDAIAFDIPAPGTGRRSFWTFGA